LKQITTAPAFCGHVTGTYRTNLMLKLVTFVMVHNAAEDGRTDRWMWVGRCVRSNMSLLTVSTLQNIRAQKRRRIPPALPTQPTLQCYINHCQCCHPE